MTSEKTILGEGKYLQLAKEGTWEYVHRIRGIGAAAILAVTSDKEFLFVEQYRVAIGHPVIDLPAGLVGDDDATEDDFEEAARRELLEETGYSAKKLKLLIAGPTTSGLATELVHIYLAKNAKKVHDGGGVDGENITTHVVPFHKLKSWFKRQQKLGKQIDVKAFFAANWYIAHNSK